VQIKEKEKMVLESSDYLYKCIDFIKQIGIEVEITKESKENFLPGIEIWEGKLIVNINNLQFPGDILHEAGHIAVVPKSDRNTLNAENIGKRQNREAEEMMAIAWSYAACMHIGLPASFVFHDGGYKGGGDYLVENFTQKRYIGLPMLQYHGMCFDETNAEIHNLKAYPTMQKWCL
jgi:hypothetical protein